MQVKTDATPRFRALDSLRGIAATIVVFHHLIRCYAQDFDDHLGVLHPLLAMGARAAVMFFFVLSGFVLSLPYFGGRNDAYVPFLLRRFLRLYPPFAFAVVVSAAGCFWLGGHPAPLASEWTNSFWGTPLTAKTLASHLLITGLHEDSFRLDATIWSLVIEMRIALIFPFMVWCVRRFEWESIGLALIASYICAIVGNLIGETLPTSPVVSESVAGAVLLTISYIFFFLIGIFAARRMQEIEVLFRKLPLILHLGIVLALIGTWCTFLAMGLAGRGYVDVLYGVAAVYIVMAALTFPRFGGLLSSRACLWLGDVSYSLYLIHLPILLTVLYLANGHLPLMPLLAIAVAAILLAAHAMHRMVEQPSTDLGRKISQYFRIPPAGS